MDDVIKIMANGALKSARWSSFWSRSDAEDLMRAALAALEAKGYVVARPSPGIHHPQEPYEGEPT